MGDDRGDGIKCRAESIETVGDVHYLFCSIDRDHQVVVKSIERLNVGTNTSFSIEHREVFKGSFLADLEPTYHGR